MPRLSGQEVVDIICRFAFSVISQKGSHAKLRRVTASGAKQTLVVPLHDELDRGTLHAIYRQASSYISEQDLEPFFYTD